jgi:hypothetical protein
MDPDPDPGGPKTCGSGSATLLKHKILCVGGPCQIRGLKTFYSLGYSIGFARVLYVIVTKMTQGGVRESDNCFMKTGE